MANKDKIKGGYADGMSPEDIAKKHNVSVDKIKDQLKMGIKVEMEHVDDEKLSEEIALDHLVEIPDYYDRLEDMEEKAKEEMEDKKEVNESKENISDWAKRMRELAGLSENQEKKYIKTVEEGASSFEEGATFMAKDMMDYSDADKKESMNESVNKSEEEDFETHKFEQKTIEEGENDDELYSLNENTIIILDFMDEDEDTLGQ